MASNIFQGIEISNCVKIKNKGYEESIGPQVWQAQRRQIKYLIKITRKFFAFERGEDEFCALFFPAAL